MSKNVNHRIANLVRMYELRIGDLVENIGFEPMTIPRKRFAFLIKLILLISIDDLYRCKGFGVEYLSRTDDPLLAKQVL